MDGWSSALSWFSLNQDSFVKIIGDVAASGNTPTPIINNESDAGVTLVNLDHNQSYFFTRVFNFGPPYNTSINFSQILPKGRYTISGHSYSRISSPQFQPLFNWNNQASFNFTLTAYPHRWYGLFIGLHHPRIPSTPDNPGKLEFNGNKCALELYYNFKSYSNCGDAKILIGDLTTNGVPLNAIQGAINQLKSEMSPEDSFFLYIASHGGDDNGYYVLIGNPDVYLTAQNLYSMISPPNLPDTDRKFIVIDACYSAGFWDNLQQLKNTSLLASAPRDKIMCFDPLTGKSFFTKALEEALSINSLGYINADLNNIGTVLLVDLISYVAGWRKINPYFYTNVGGGSFGDMVIFAPELWSPQGFKIDDFVDGFVGLQFGRSVNMSPILFLLLD